MTSPEYTVPVGQPDAAPSLLSGPYGKYVILGGVGIAVAAVIIIARRGSGATAPAADDSSNAPGIDPAIAIGSLEQQVREQDALFSGLREDILGGFDASSRQLADTQTALTDLINSSKADVLASMGVSLDGHGTLADQINNALAHLSEGQKQIFDQQWRIAQQQAAANWQIFSRASDPNWMPGPNDPVFS